MSQPSYPYLPDPFLPPHEEDVELKVVLFNYLKSWPFILVCTVVGVMAALLFNKYSTPIYSVQSSIIVADEPQNLGADMFESVGLLPLKSNVENEIGILKSYTLAKQAIQELELDVFYFTSDLLLISSQQYASLPVEIEVDWSVHQLVGGKFELEVLDGNTYRISAEEDEYEVFDPADPFYKTKTKSLPSFASQYTFGENVVSNSLKFKVQDTGANPGDILQFELVDYHSLALILQDKISVSPINKQASILNIGFETPVRKLGEDYLNKLMEVYLQRELDLKNQAAENTIRFIENQLSGITDSLAYFEGRLERYRSENKIFNLSEEGSQIFLRLQELEKDKAQTEISIKYYQTLQSYLSSEELDDLVAPSITGNSDPLLQSLVVKLSELQAEKLRLSANFSDQTPAMREINNQIRNTKKALLENVTSSIRNTNTVLTEINTQIRRIEKEINTLPETERRLLGIQRKFTVNENIYLYLLQKRAESEILRASNMPKNAILDYARAGQEPVFPRKLLNLVIGLAGGLIFAVGFITVRDFLNTKIEDPKELEKHIKTPLIGMIGRNFSNDPKPVLNNPKSAVTESFRNIRADMSYLVPNQNQYTILFTSSFSGEGKTFASVNMASVYCLLGKKTLLMGLDLRKPKIAEEFGLVNDKGISTCLSLGTPWQEVVKKTKYDNLDVILSGPIPPNPAELLVQSKFAVIMAEIKSHYDVVIMDCPPVGLVSETKELFRYSDVNFFIFRQEYSYKSNIQVLNNLIDKGGTSNIYAILNDVHLDSGYGFGYSYGYGYGYSSGYGYHEEVQPPWWKRALRRRRG